MSLFVTVIIFLLYWLKVMLTMMKEKIENKYLKAVQSDELSKPYDNRYVMINTRTGEILDDAQGYGYKTIKKAFAAFCYKQHNSKSDAKKKKALQKRIGKWLDSHRSLSSYLDDCLFRAYKYQEEDQFDEQFLKDVLKEYNIELTSFSVKQLLEYYGIK